MRLAVSITSAPWLDDRALALAGILRRLDIGGQASRDAGLDRFHVETTPGPNWKWGEAQWKWALATGCDAALFLQDDILTPEAAYFWPILTAMLGASRGNVLGLHTRHPEAEGLYAKNRHWISTTEMVGTGYVFWREELKNFLTWREAMGESWVRAIDEDTSIGEGWAKMTGKRIYHPIPTIIDHDIELMSTAGNDDDPERQPTVTWKDVGGGTVEAMKTENFWRQGLDDTPHYVVHRL